LFGNSPKLDPLSPVPLRQARCPTHIPPREGMRSAAQTHWDSLRAEPRKASVRLSTVFRRTGGPFPKERLDSPRGFRSHQGGDVHRQPTSRLLGSTWMPSGLRTVLHLGFCSRQGEWFVTASDAARSPCRY